MEKLFIVIILASIVSAKSFGQSPLNLDSVVASGTAVEVEPRFPGGEASWLQFLKDNLNYNTPRLNDAPTGCYRVRIKFTVFADGHLGNFIKLTSQGFGTEDEIIRVLKKSPDWKPKMRNGVALDSEKIQSVTFSVGG